MKNLFILLVATLTFVSCKETNNGYDNAQVVVNQPKISVTPEVSNLGDNLNLQALGELVKNSTSAQDIEDKLNTTGSINNLDLNGDGSVDYIKVTEYGDNNVKGFSFTVDIANGQTQEVATIEVSKGTNDSQLNIQGNQQLYGNNNYYQSRYSLSDLLIMNYLFSYHRPYYSPYHYGYYPSYYHSYRSVPVTSYRTRMVSTTRTTTISRTSTPVTHSSVTSPNANKSVSSVIARARTMSAPTHSQKSFTTTSASRQRPSTSGFSNRSSSNSSSHSSFSSGSSSRSSGSSSHSSFSGSSHSSHSSFGGGRKSDIRFKQNIEPLTCSLDKVIALQGVTYDWRINEFPKENFNNIKQNGFIAQDVEKLFPNLVYTRPDGYKTVDYEMLVPSLTEAIKELKIISDKQGREIEQLKLQLGNKNL